MKAALFLLGVIVLGFGVLFALQGAGIVHWPRESFMLDQHDWTYRGILVGLIGIALIISAWRMRQK